MNPADIIVLLCVAAAVGLAVWLLLRSRRNGGGPSCGGCDGDCSHCSRGRR